MKFLVTGANGFVGKPLCEELLARGHAVKGAVRTPLPLADHVEAVVVGDIDGGTDWQRALEGVDVVIHLAARVHVMRDDAVDPLAEFLKVNLQGTENLAHQAAHAGVKRLVYASSVKVNGEQTAGDEVFTESDTANPQDPYGVSKWQAEQALRRIASETALEFAIVRPPLVYGPGVKGNFISLFKAVGQGVPLPLAGARNARNLVYVGNLVDALIACATHPAAAGQTYLVRDGEEVSTASLVKKIATALGRADRSFYFPPGLLRAAAALLGRSAQIDRLFGSLRVNDAKIQRELGWVPPYTLEQGLRVTADWYIKQ
ncbi:MAG: SDR family oxidoreductase [Nitrosomonadales bacterium]|nr:SDR family oxidoreductase [Nitrosomonadales bacterium]